MTAQELRIGNLVKINDKHQYIPYHNLHVEIIGIDSQNFLKEKGLVGSATVKQLHFTSGIWIDYLQPIPLTGKMLLNFGFELIDEVYKLQYNQISLQVRFYKEPKVSMMVINEKEKKCLYIEVENIKQVHQLQNLYYALTQKELCLK